MSTDYDRLSDLGRQQSRLLGEYWATRGERFHQVFTGPAQRHRHTAELVGDAFRSAGIEFPEPQVIPEMDEFDGYQMMKSMVPVMVERDERIRALNDAFRENQHSPEAGIHLERLFEAVARHWCSGEYDVPDVESWAQFRARVCRGITQIRERTGRSARSVVFTSAGPIAATIGLALELTPARALELIWVSRNCSFSEFLYNAEQFSLSVLNAVPHLDDSALLTYR